MEKPAWLLLLVKSFITVFRSVPHYPSCASFNIALNSGGYASIFPALPASVIPWLASLKAIISYVYRLTDPGESPLFVRDYKAVCHATTR
jgi:hypothetical protein